MKRINLIPPIRKALVNAGISTFRVVEAVNAELGKLEATKESAKLGTGSVTKAGYKVTGVVSTVYKGNKTIPLLFDAWHGKVEAAYKVAGFDEIAIPGIFSEWLSKLKKHSETEVAETEAVTS